MSTPSATGPRPKKLTPAQERMHFAVASLTKYMATYDKQSGYLDYSDDTFINDVLYGIGRALDKKYEFADGFRAFKDFLRGYLSAPSETVATVSEERLKEVLRPALDRVFDHFDDMPMGRALQILVDALRDLEPSAPSATRPIGEVSVPFADVINTPCPFCGKKPIEGMA